MPPRYIKRVSTVLSFRQMADDEGVTVVPPATSDLMAGPAATSSSEVLAPNAAVSLIAGTPVAKYAFAVQAPRKAHTLRRLSSSDMEGVVPALDDISNGCPPTVWGDSDDGEESICGAAARLAAGQLSSDSAGEDEGGLGAVVPQKSLLDNVLLALWEDCAEQGLFRYDVTACPTRLVVGNYGFVAQLNVGRASQKRATEIRVDQVCQPFDEAKFNFKKAFMREVLFQFEPRCDVPLRGRGAGALAAGGGESILEEASLANSSPNLVLINVSPIEYGHVLLCPRVLDGLPQLVCPATALLALRFAMESENPYCRVGYNSLGAYATINHLHFQAYYLAVPFPCERAPCELVKGLKRKRSNVRISRLVNYPVNGFVIEVGDSVEEMAAVVGQACQALQKRDVPHNLLITDSGARVFLWPQCYAEKQSQELVPEDILATGVNPAVFEIAGHLVLKRAEDYDTLTQDFAWRMLAEVSLAEEAFMALAPLIFG